MATPLEEAKEAKKVKCIVVGDGSVGKTSLLMRYATNKFPEIDVPSRFDPYTAKLTVDESPVEFVLWDAVGQDGDDELRTQDYTDTDVFIVCFSITDPASFESVKTKWVPELRKHDVNIPWFLVGTKEDLEEDQDTLDKLKERNLEPITFLQGDDVADDLDAVMYVQCSALAGTGVQDVFDTVLQAGLEYQFYCEHGGPPEDETPSVKCLLVGESGVGKTCLVICYVTNVFPQQYVPTLFDHYTANVTVSGEPLKYTVCDSAGDNAFDELRPLDYPTTDVCLVCFSIADPASFESVKTRWVPELKQHRPKIPLVLVGTKQDLQEDQETLATLKKKNLTPITFAQGSDMAREINAVKYVECSALDKKGVRAAFDAALQAAIDDKFCKPPDAADTQE